MFKEIFEQIKQYEVIIIHRHTYPDGDALGSQLGLKHLLKANFPDKAVYAVGDSAGRYSFMQGSCMDVIDDSTYTNALAVILDTSSTSLISDNRYLNAKHRVRIDHHLFCGKIAETEVVDTSFESCCGLIAAFATECNLLINVDAATALYTGMVTDSGRFRYDSVTKRTFELAATLLAAGIDVNAIYTNLYAEEFESVKLRAAYTLKICFTPENVAYIYSTKQDVAATGKEANSISRGMVGVMGDIKGVNIWVNFTENDDGVLCEIRSNKYNINRIAVRYGGGGHAKASGAFLPDKDTAFAILDELNKLQEGQ